MYFSPTDTTVDIWHLMVGGGLLATNQYVSFLEARGQHREVSSVQTQTSSEKGEHLRVFLKDI